MLHGANTAKVGTDVFITDKAGVRDLPEDKRREEGVLQRKENTQMVKGGGTGVRINAKPTNFGGAGRPPLAAATAAERGDQEMIFGNKAIGPTYNMLRPEVKTCLDKVMYQLDLCKNTLGLLEKRISTSESNLQAVMEFIRTEDINYVSASAPLPHDRSVRSPSLVLILFNLLTRSLLFYSCLETLPGPSSCGRQRFA